MLSSARIYIFGVKYKKLNWITILMANQLSALIAQMFSDGIQDFTFKQLKFINVFRDDGSYDLQIHIDKIVYKKQRILSKEYISDLKYRINGQLKKIMQLEFNEIHIVNDEFIIRSTSTFSNGVF